MAAQARSYEKSISYSSRQVDDKYIPKNHRHSNHQPSSRDSSPYRNKLNHHSSPNGRKRPYDSPSSVSSKHSNSPYEVSRKKDRGMNNPVKSSNTQQIDSDWSQHVSSSGKVYYYNRRTEESQWEVPKDWIDRQKETKNIQRNNHFSRDTRTSNSNNKNFSQNDKINKDTRDNRSYKLPPDKNFARDYKDNRNNRDKVESWNNRDRERDRDSRNSRDLKDYFDGKYKSSSGSSSQRDTKYNSLSVKTHGQSTPLSSSTSLNRSYRGTPDQINGVYDVLQDISPPGTPTNDDVINISNISPAPVYTPHGCSPLLNSSNSIMPLPTTPCTPLLSPVVLNAAVVGQLPAPFLHPLQQALLLQQQQIPVNKDMYGSPKLPTVKNHFADTGSASSSPRLSSSFHQKSSPLHSSRSNSSSTPPPPPPPPKVQHLESREGGRNKLDRYHRNNSSFDARSEHHSPRNDLQNRSKSFDCRSDDTSLKPKSSETRYNSERSLKKQQQKKDNELTFPELPSVDHHFVNYTHFLGDFASAFSGSVVEKQVSAVWDETMGYLHADGCQTKHRLFMARNDSDLQELKFDVSSNWNGALNTVLVKVESLQDSSMTSSESRSRDHKPTPMPRKQKYDTSIDANGIENENKSNSSVNPERHEELVDDKLPNVNDSRTIR
ncbi:probable serine/threonine-protein kinase DDB_G0276461 [Hydractinia symbiolongicarpus]|uniref:probable serine/threonine-protein kinase DDB_G0276461 n=1 Tax=Hydractinia symbiolongicarpus TaxID=13093 RepID=UPI002550313B|nr:probable serine/threonine-protein kinase DDB_G0276461 [Hydractinia symbiolongicarpus]